MIDTAALKRLDPRPFLEANYGLAFRGTMALCPFHNDKSPSLSVYENGEGWAWKCHSPSCGASGDVIAFVMRFEAIDFKAAAAKFADWAGALGDTAKPAPAEKASAPAPTKPAARKPREPLGPLVESYSYVDAQGREIYKIHRHRDPKDFLSEPKGIKREDRVLYHLPEVIAAATVWIVEGEKDVRSTRALGLTATCWSHGVTAWLPHYAAALKGKDVLISLDRGYRAEEEKAARDIIKVAKSVRIVELPGLTEKDQDISDWIELHDAQEPEDLRAELERIAAETPLFGAEPDEFPGLELDPKPDPEPSPEAPQPAMAPAAEAGPEPAGEKPAPMSLTLADVEPRTVPWLWPDFIPLGRATLVSGDPGCGKSWFCLDLASRLSRGFGWPDGSASSGPARTYYMTVEDDLHDTIRPRINSLGGDPELITCYNPEQPLHVNLASPEGLARLESEIARLGNVRLLVTDPIIDFSGRANPNKAEDVRALLTPLVQMAARQNFALVMIGHLNKAQALSAIYRAGGSTSGWLGKCRAAFMVFRDADDKPLRHVIPIKANLARQDPAQLEFRITNGRLEIELSTEDVDPDDQLNPQRGPKPRERDDAASWLRDYFVGRDEIPATEIEDAARRQGISESTLKRAKKQAGYRSVKRSESGGRTVWAWTKGATIL